MTPLCTAFLTERNSERNWPSNRLSVCQGIVKYIYFKHSILLQLHLDLKPVFSSWQIQMLLNGFCFLELEQGCRVNPMGTGYVGSQAISSSGDTCLAWSGVKVDYNPLPLELNSTTNRNFCRNMIGTDSYYQPFCFVSKVDDDANSVVQQQSPCSIPFCGKWIHAIL